MQRAPARIDLAGGTLDIPPLCFLIPEAVTLNLAIDLAVRVDMTPSAAWSLTVNGEPAPPPRELPLFDQALRRFACDNPMALRVESRIPRASGLGGSSSLLTAATQLLARRLRGHDLEPETLLGEVTVLEHRLLGKPAGSQDAIAAIYGGLSAISFDRGFPDRAALPLPDFLAGPLYLAHARDQHHSGLNNWQIVKAACEGDAATLDSLGALARNARAMHDALRDADRARFVASLREEARLRHGLADFMLTDAMRGFAADLDDRWVAKVCGAGGGGCMFVFGGADPDELAPIARRHGLELIKTRVVSVGCAQAAS